jgi:hypothetical protein
LRESVTTEPCYQNDQKYAEPQTPEHPWSNIHAGNVRTLFSNNAQEWLRTYDLAADSSHETFCHIPIKSKFAGARKQAMTGSWSTPILSARRLLRGGSLPFKAMYGDRSDIAGGGKGSM